MTLGYIRVSTEKQTVQNQKHEILEYANKHSLGKVEFIEIEMSSRKSTKDRKIDKLLELLQENDTLIVSELSRLARSLSGLFSIVNQLIDKNIVLIAIKQNMTLNKNNINDMQNKVMLTMFSLMSELERDFVSARTKEALKARKDTGVILGKPKGTIQSSMYDEDKEKINELVKLGVSINKISKLHLGYGTAKSLGEYIKRLKLTG
ncbi:MAG: recombinase family protein [Campylobacterota bacterium]|nr:recombinase family protein [Campylobacterota bacterium]